MFRETLISARSSEWSDTEANREVQVFWGCIHEQRKARLRTGFSNWQGLCSNVSFALFGFQETRIVEKSKALVFRISFSLPYSHLWSRISSNNRKSVITTAGLRNDFFFTQN